MISLSSLLACLSSSVDREARAADAGPACGGAGLPECPLQAFMLHDLEPALLAGDGPALAASFDRLAAVAPPGFPHWSSIARDGAAAARAGEIEASKGACRGCHAQYRASYRDRHRARPL